MLSDLSSFPENPAHPVWRDMQSDLHRLVHIYSSTGRRGLGGGGEMGNRKAQINSVG